MEIRKRQKRRIKHTRQPCPRWRPLFTALVKSWLDSSLIHWPMGNEWDLKSLLKKTRRRKKNFCFLCSSLMFSLDFSLLSFSVWGLCNGHLFSSLGQLQGCPEKLGDGHWAQMWPHLHQQDDHCDGDDLSYSLIGQYWQFNNSIRNK